MEWPGTWASNPNFPNNADASGVRAERGTHPHADRNPHRSDGLQKQKQKQKAPKATVVFSTEETHAQQLEKASSKVPRRGIEFIGLLKLELEQAKRSMTLGTYEKQQVAARLTCHPCGPTTWDRCVKVYNPYASTSIAYWDIVLTFTLIYVAVAVPYEISFLTSEGMDGLYYFNRLVDIIFIFDMFFSFNTAYLNEETNEVVMNRRKIAWHYIMNEFIVDLVSMVPVVSVVMDLYYLSRGEEAGSQLSFLKTLRVTRLLRLSKIIRLLRMSTVMRQLEAKYAINYSMLQLYTFLIALFYLSHFIACGWYMVIELENNKECIIFTSWVESQECCYNWWSCHGPTNKFSVDGHPQSASRKYFISLGWAMGNMLTTGSDVNAVTDVERAYLLVVRVLAGVVYAYLIGTVCSIFDSMTKSRQQFFERMDNLNQVLLAHNVQQTNPELCAKLRTFYRYRHGYFDRDYKGLAEVMDNISQHLRGKVTHQVYKAQIERIQIFHSMSLTDELISDVTVHLVGKPFGPDERLIQADDLANCVLFLQMGIVLSQARVHLEGSAVGEDAVFAYRQDTRRGYDAITMTHGIANFLDINNLQQVISNSRYAEQGAVLVKRIASGRGRHLITEFSNIFRKVGETTSNYDKALTLMKKSMIWTYDEATYTRIHEVCIKYLVGYYGKTHPEHTAPLRALKSLVKAKMCVLKFRATRSKLLIKSRLIAILRPHGLQHLAQKFMDEKITKEHWEEMTENHLHLLGVPLGTAMDIVSARVDKKLRSKKGQIEQKGNNHFPMPFRKKL